MITFSKAFRLDHPADFRLGSQTMSFSQQPSDLEFVILNFIRNQYEKKYRQNVPLALKYLTYQFSKKIIGSELLTNKQDLNFFELLSTKLPSIRKFNFLFRASDHNYSAKKFHDHCDGKPGTITIIKSNWGNIFGGYTSKSWHGNYYCYVRDENAFLFLIESKCESVQHKCPLLLELADDDADYAIHCADNCGPIFGAGYDIAITDNCNKQVDIEAGHWYANSCRQLSYDTPEVSSICGGNVTHEQRYLLQVMDYELFQIIQ